MNELSRPHAVLHYHNSIRNIRNIDLVMNICALTLFLMTSDGGVEGGVVVFFNPNLEAY